MPLDDAQLLSALSKRWAATRLPEVADLVELLSMQMPSPPLGGRSKAEQERTWHAAAQRRDPSTLGSLLSSAWPRRWKDGLRRLDALHGWLDPRIATALVRLIQALPYRQGTAYPVYLSALRGLGELRDARQVAPLEKAGAALMSHFSQWVFHSDFKRGAEGRSLVEALKAQPPVAVAPDDLLLAQGRARVAGSKQQAQRRSKTESELLEGIYAEPASEDLRRVYADWLLEHGDVRGEFINLQCERAAGRGTPRSLRREKQILQEHRGRLLGPLAPYVGDASTFERGFLSRAATDTGMLERGMAEPAWATVTVLVLPEHGDAAVLARFLAGPGRSVRGLHNVRLDLVQALESLAPDLPLEELSLRLWKAAPFTLRWPTLRSLGLIRPRAFFALDRKVRDWDALIEEGLWRRLTSIACNDTWEDFRDWHARFRRMGWLTRVRVLALESESVLEPEGFELRFERDSPGSAMHLVVVAHPGARDVAALQSGLGALPLELRAALTIEGAQALNATERRVLEELRSE